MPELTQPSKAKYAWREIDRREQPKRAAAERIADFCETYSLLDEETVREQASRCLQCPKPSCRTGCPLSNRIPEWLALASEGDFLGAAEICRTTSNMPEICSRVCPQERLCEGSCILNGRSDAVCIGAIEKFINEYALAHDGCNVSRAEPNGFKVAVIGSGPGGMACADELAKLGYAVDIFEAQPLAGGLLMNGIPSFKLEKSVVERRLNILRKRGVDFWLGVHVGKDVSLQTILDSYDAVFLGIGAQKAKELDIPGAELKGIYQSLPFLIQKNVLERSHEIEISNSGYIGPAADELTTSRKNGLPSPTLSSRGGEGDSAQPLADRSQRTTDNSLSSPRREGRGEEAALSYACAKSHQIDVRGKRVVVLGGGDTAMDCLRTAVRCGAAEATCIYRRDLANMPGSRKEYANALEEGAQFLFLTNPVALQGDGNGNVAGVHCIRMELGEPDASGRRKPRPMPGTEFVVAADVLIIAYGFDPVPFPAGGEFSKIAVNDWGAIKVDGNQMTSVPGVFAGGDDVRGPSLVVHAVRDGRKAAEAIDKYVQSRRQC